MYSRAVWKEDDEIFEGPLPSNWIQNDVVFWPKNKPSLKFAARCNPEMQSDSWAKYPLIKIKFTTNLLREAKSTAKDTTDTDSSDISQKKRKRNTIATAKENSVPWDAVIFSSDDAKTVKKSRPDSFRNPSKH